MGKLNVKANWTQFERQLQPKDGNKHIIMINSFSKLNNAWFSCDTKYTTEIDAIISKMSQMGYEIIDIKFDTVDKRGGFGIRYGYNTLIVYK